MAKGNIAINKSIAKKVVNGAVMQVLPVIEQNGVEHTLFSIISPDQCVSCKNDSFNVNKHRSRYIISSYGIIECPVTDVVCSRCEKHHHDIIVGVTGQNNYSDEYIDKQLDVRYEGRCSLWNSHIVGEIFTEGITDTAGRAPCPTSLWKYEQKKGKISGQELVNQEIDFNGSLHIDGYWVKSGWRTYIEAQLGRVLDKREWKMIRYNVIYVVATEDKVVVDFQITQINPSYRELVPLLERVKKRLSEKQITKIVSDEEEAIIGAVECVFKDVPHAFCVFHQLKNMAKKFYNHFSKNEVIPQNDLEVYGIAIKLILADTAISSSVYYKEIIDMMKNLELTRASTKVIEYCIEIYFNNLKLLKRGFIPETNNAIEQLFSLVDNFVDQAKSFKTCEGLLNFFNNLFNSLNNRRFNTGAWRGFSPRERAKMKSG